MINTKTNRAQRVARFCICFAAFGLFSIETFAAEVSVDFSDRLRDWDGFGVNYVQARHTRDYKVFDQDYGGFKYLNDAQRAKVIDLVFGEDGLKPGIVKAFCDPFHEPTNDNDDPYKIDPAGFDHKSTTKWIRYFGREGLKKTRAWGGDLTFLAGLYGPPGWTTKQKVLRGRDLDPGMKREVAEYIAAWAKYLRNEEGLPVKYVSMHNEGEDKKRWPPDGGDSPDWYQHDYNMWWPDDQLVDFLKFARGVLDANGLRDVGIACGETSNWTRFVSFKTPDGVVSRYAQAIRNDPAALRNLGLITSHGFQKQYNPEGIDLLRKARPDLHAWTTSYTWGDMSLDILEDARGLIYGADCNGLIPWATVHHDFESDKLSPPRKFRKSSNANSPIKTNDGKIEVTKAYYHFKQMSRAGQPGMAVAAVTTGDPDVQLIAFASNGTQNADASVVLNKSKKAKAVVLSVKGAKARTASAFVTTDVEFGDRNYEALGMMKVVDGKIAFDAPARSSTTLFFK